MECPSCKKELKCKFSIEKLKEALPVVFTYQWWKCSSCAEKFYGILEENKMNIFDDRLEHQGFKADAGQWENTLKWAKKCPNPKNSRCTCTVHQNLTDLEFHGIQAWYSFY